MTKQEAIAKAYYPHWETVKDFVNENGWMFTNGQNFYVSFKYHERGFGFTHRIRPKSLAGIENNRGWIRIESEADLPKDENVFWVVTEEKEIVEMEYFPKYKSFTEQGVTHYQPIVKPKKPIY